MFASGHCNASQAGAGRAREALQETRSGRDANLSAEARMNANRTEPSLRPRRGQRPTAGGRLAAARGAAGRCPGARVPGGPAQPAHAHATGRPSATPRRDAIPRRDERESAGSPGASRPSARQPRRPPAPPSPSGAPAAGSRRPRRDQHPDRPAKSSRPPPASRPPTSAARPRRRMRRPFSVKRSRSVPATAIASVTRKIPSAGFAASATRIVAGATWTPSAISPARTPSVVQRRADQPRLAVAELAHRVEEMRDHPRARGEGRRRLGHRRRRCGRG